MELMMPWFVCLDETDKLVAGLQVIEVRETRLLLASEGLPWSSEKLVRGVFSRDIEGSDSKED
jgi:hypothetical protein